MKLKHYRYMQDEDLMRDKIIQGAKGLFQQYGLKKTTMDEIAKSIRMGKSSLYYYFKSKDEVFDAVLNDELMKLRSVVDKAVKKQSTLNEKLTVYANTYYDELIPRQTLYRVINSDDSEAGSKTRLKMILTAEVDYLKKILNENKEVDSTLNYTEEQFQKFTETIVYAIYGVIHYSFMIDGEINRGKFGEMMHVLMKRLF